MSGTAISQIISILITPILTRNYTPRDFGMYTTFLAIYSLLCSFTTGKFERVIFFYKNRNDIVIVSSLCLVISVIFSCFCFLILQCTGILLDISKWGIDDILIKWLYAIPFFLLIYAVNTIFLTFLNYEKEFSQIAKSRIIKTFVSIFTSFICIFFLKDMGGLILGEIIGLFISTIYLFPRLKFLFQFQKKISSNFYSVFFRYKNFPLYNIPADFLNVASAQVPAFFLTTFFGANTTGFYSLMKRVLDAPINLLSSSILEVFRQRAASQFLETGDCRILFINTAKKLLLLSVLPFSLLFIFAPYFFELFFGNDWYVAGDYARIFSIFYFFKFISSPLSYMFYIAERQKIDFLLHIYMFLSTLLIFYSPAIFSFSSFEILMLYAINFSLIYILYFFLSYTYTIRVNC